ncbi:DNA repair protein RAD52 homolog [Bacillus rossius redtenbacheri]|uniref:DNA repair protein RAD52 homolog n=1 Tax=Bacillus rossius redtenbacheri TaxID=93214 RepID=UPI002FDD0592
MAALNNNRSFQDSNAKYLGCCATYHDLISIANTSFGANCWSHSITRQDIDYIDIINDKYAVGAVAFVKVVTSDGVHHEEMGYGMSSQVDNKGTAILTARKEAAKNALLEALRSFGGTILAKVSEVDVRDDQMAPGMSVMWTGGNCSFGKRVPSPVLNRTVEKPAVPESASLGKKAEQIPPLKKANNLTEEERRRQERINRQRQKQEEFRKKLKQNEIPKSDIEDLANWDDDCIPGDSFVSMPDEHPAVPLGSGAPRETASTSNFSPPGQENRVVSRNRTPLAAKMSMSMGMGLGSAVRQNRA